MINSFDYCCEFNWVVQQYIMKKLMVKLQGIGFEIIGIVILDILFCKFKIGIVLWVFKLILGIVDLLNIVMCLKEVVIVVGLDVFFYLFESKI